MFLILLGLILRPVCFKFRSKILNNTWRSFWDWSFFISGIIPSFLFGLVSGNVVLGLPFSFDTDLRVTYHGSFWDCFDYYAILSGILFLTLFLAQGAAYLYKKADVSIAPRAYRILKVMSYLSFVIFCCLIYLTLFSVKGYYMQTHGHVSNPLLKSVIVKDNAWMSNYRSYPIFLIFPCLTLVGITLISFIKNPLILWLSTSLMIFSVISSAGIALFPFMLPSSYHLPSSLTFWDASSSQQTLQAMLVCCLIFLPIVLSYVRWVYYVFRGRVTHEHISENGQSY